MINYEDIVPNSVKIKNHNTNTTLFVGIDEFSSIKNLLSEESTYESVYVSPNNIVYGSEMFKLCL